MAVTLESLQALLSAPDIQIFSDGASTLLYRFMHRGQMLHIDASIADDGGYIRFIIPCYLNLYIAGDRAALMAKLLELNRTYKLLKFSCDPEDGEICVSIELPVYDGILTQDQASQCMYLLSHVAVQERDRLVTFQKTGIYPSSGDPNFTQSVEHILEGAGLESEESSTHDSRLDLFSDETAPRE